MRRKRKTKHMLKEGFVTPIGINVLHQDKDIISIQLTADPVIPLR